MLGIGSLILGGINTIGGLIGLATQPKSPEYTMSPDMKAILDQSRQMAKQGFTGAEQAAYESQIARQGATASQRAADISGGGMAQAVSGTLGAAQFGAANQMALQGAGLMRQNIGRYREIAGLQQNILDRNTQQKIQENLSRQQAFGQALQSGLSQLGSYGNMMGQGDFMKQNPEMFGLNRTANPATTAPASAGFTPTMGVSPRIQSPAPLGGYNTGVSPVVQNWMNSGMSNTPNLNFSNYNFPNLSFPQ